MCHFHCCTVSSACLDKGQIEALLVRRNYGIACHVGDKPEVFWFTHMSFKTGLSKTPAFPPEQTLSGLRDWGELKLLWLRGEKKVKSIRKGYGSLVRTGGIGLCPASVYPKILTHAKLNGRVPHCHVRSKLMMCNLKLLVNLYAPLFIFEICPSRTLYSNFTGIYLALLITGLHMSRTQNASFSGLTLKVPFSCWHIQVLMHPLPQPDQTGLLETQ